MSPLIQIGFGVVVNHQRRVPLNRCRPLSSHHITVLMMEETPSNENSEGHSITPPPPNDATPTAVSDADADADVGADADADPTPKMHFSDF